MMITAKSMEELNFDLLLDVYMDELKMRRQQNEFYLYLLDFFKDPGSEYHIWETNGEYLCVLRTEKYRDGRLIEGFHTHVSKRGRGYAKLLLSAVCDSYSAPIYAHVDKRNVPSMRAHLSCGFRQILDYAVFIDGSVSWNSSTLCMHKTPCRD